MVYEALIPLFYLILLVLATWEAVWKAIAFWKSARNNQLAWFIVIAVFNTMGILPIVYLLFFQKKGQILVKKSRK